MVGRLARWQGPVTLPSPRPVQPQLEELERRELPSTSPVLVADVNPGSKSSAPYCLTNVSGTLFFRATDGVHGYELFKSDGTSSGTVLVKDINPGSRSSDPLGGERPDRTPAPAGTLGLVRQLHR